MRICEFLVYFRYANYLVRVFNFTLEVDPLISSFSRNLILCVCSSRFSCSLRPSQQDTCQAWFSNSHLDAIVHLIIARDSKSTNGIIKEFDY